MLERTKEPIELHDDHGVYLSRADELEELLQSWAVIPSPASPVHDFVRDFESARFAIAPQLADLDLGLLLALIRAYARVGRDLERLPGHAVLRFQFSQSSQQLIQTDR